MFWPFDKFAPCRALSQHSGEIWLAEDVAKKLGVARDPAIALCDRPLGIYGDEFVQQFSFQIHGSRAGAPVK